MAEDQHGFIIPYLRNAQAVAPWVPRLKEIFQAVGHGNTGPAIRNRARFTFRSQTVFALPSAAGPNPRMGAPRRGAPFRPRGDPRPFQFAQGYPRGGPEGENIRKKREDFSAICEATIDSCNVSSWRLVPLRG